MARPDDIMDISELGTGPIVLNVRLAKILNWSRTDIEFAERAINVLVRGIVALPPCAAWRYDGDDVIKSAPVEAPKKRRSKVKP